MSTTRGLRVDWTRLSWFDRALWIVSFLLTGVAAISLIFVGALVTFIPLAKAAVAVYLVAVAWTGTTVVLIFVAYRMRRWIWTRARNTNFTQVFD